MEGFEVKGNRTNKKIYDITVLFSQEFGCVAGKHIIIDLAKLGKDYVKLCYIPCPTLSEIGKQGSHEPHEDEELSIKIDFGKPFYQDEVEDIVSQSKALVVVLSKGILNLASARFAMNAAVHYKTKTVLVHDQATCFFPGENEQPQNLKDAGVFHDKAITFMGQYAHHCVKGILKKASKTTMKTFDLCFFGVSEYIEMVQTSHLLSKIDCIFVSDDQDDYNEEDNENKAKNEEVTVDHTGEKVAIHEEKNFSYSNVKESIANSKAVVVILSDAMDYESNLNFFLEIAILFSVRIHILYDEKNNKFMLIDIQRFTGDRVKKAGLLQNEKVIMFTEKIESAIAKIIGIEQKFGSCRDTDEIATRCFLSHKRSSAQGMTGRIFQGLKSEYKVFLDSEADFDLHDLKLIVKSTRLFIFILSEGIFDSYWCLQELKTAVDFGKRVLIVRDYLFRIPEKIPSEAEYVMKNSVMIDYMAEFYEQAVALIKEELGPADSIIKSINDTLRIKEPHLLAGLESKNLESFDWCLKFFPVLSAKISLQEFIHAVCKYFDFPTENIKKIDLSGCQRVKDSDLHYTLSSFPNLEEIDLSECKEITDIGLRYIGKSKCASKLQSIILENCREISDRGIESLAKKCHKLNKIRFDNCINIEDSSLFSLAEHCKGITEISISGCFKITPDGFSNFAQKCNTLKKIDISYCAKINDVGIKTLTDNCPDLEELRAACCTNLTNEGLEHLSKCKNFSAVDLSFCFKVTQEGLKSFSGCHNLKEISLEGCYDINDEGLEILSSGCPDLLTINLNNCFNLQDKGIETLTTNCKKIQILKLNYCGQLTDNIFPFVAGCVDLIRLEMNNLSYITNQGLENIVQLKKLKYLDFSFCSGIGDHGLSNIAKLPILEVLNLSGCESITNDGLANLSNCKKLKSLDLSENSSIDDEGLNNLCNGQENLLELNIARTSITNKGLKHIAENCNKIENLNLSDTGINDLGLDKIAKGCPHLIKLNLFDCNIGDVGLKDLVGDEDETKLYLTNINLHRCDDVTADGIKALADACGASLLEIDLSGIDNMNDASLSYISDRCTSLTKVVLSNCDKITDAGLKPGTLYVN